MKEPYDPEKSTELMHAIAAQWPQFDEPFEALNTLVHAQYLSASKNKLRIMLDGIDADALLAEGDYLHDLARTGQGAGSGEKAEPRCVFGEQTPASVIFCGLWSANL